MVPVARGPRRTGRRCARGCASRCASRRTRRRPGLGGVAPVPVDGGQGQPGGDLTALVGEVHAVARAGQIGAAVPVGQLVAEAAVDGVGVKEVDPADAGHPLGGLLVGSVEHLHEPGGHLVVPRGRHAEPIDGSGAVVGQDAHDDGCPAAVLHGPFLGAGLQGAVRDRDPLAVVAADDDDDRVGVVPVDLHGVQRPVEELRDDQPSGRMRLLTHIDRLDAGGQVHCLGSDTQHHRVPCEQQS